MSASRAKRRRVMSPRKPPPPPPLPGSLKALQPAPFSSSRVQPITAPQPPKRTFLHLPAELRVEIYRIALENVTIHILPCYYSPDNSSSSGTPPPKQPAPHPLLLTTRQIRLEVLPLIHTICPIQANITNFDFSGLLTWLSRIPQHELANGLARNPHLLITLCTSKQLRGDLLPLRRWLHDRTDAHRLQPSWKYTGSLPPDKIASDLKRRAKRMREPKRAEEFRKMLARIGVYVPTVSTGDRMDEAVDEDASG